MHTHGNMVEKLGGKISLRYLGFGFIETHDFFSFYEV